MKINRLMAAIVQNQDAEHAMDALHKAGLSATKLSSSGGFLGSHNVTLLIGLNEGQEEKAILTLSESCRRRVEYVTTPLEGAPFYLPVPTPINVGGATIFTMAIERYEVLE
jgi:uncharacterized protein YaaQ